MSSTRLEKSLLNFTAALVAVFTLVLTFNLLSFRPARKTSSSTRNPAAVNTAGQVFNQQIPSLTEAVPDLPCLKHGASFSLKSPTQKLRLESKLCKAIASELTRSRVVNRTNGFMATVFELSPSQFTTDLIDLSPGENIIQITRHYANGTRLKAELKITH